MNVIAVRSFYAHRPQLVDKLEVFREHDSNSLIAELHVRRVVRQRYSWVPRGYCLVLSREDEVLEV